MPRLKTLTHPVPGMLCLLDLRVIPCGAHRHILVVLQGSPKYWRWILWDLVLSCQASCCFSFFGVQTQPQKCQVRCPFLLFLSPPRSLLLVLAARLVLVFGSYCGFFLFSLEPTPFLESLGFIGVSSRIADVRHCATGLLVSG